MGEVNYGDETSEVQKYDENQKALRIYKDPENLSNCDNCLKVAKQSTKRMCRICLQWVCETCMLDQIGKVCIKCQEDIDNKNETKLGKY